LAASINIYMQPLPIDALLVTTGPELVRPMNLTRLA
jgi:hypothetical protein